MLKKNYLNGILLAFILMFSGCVVETTPNQEEGELVSYKNDMTAQAIEHAQEMQMLVITMQDENAVLRARNETLQKQLEKLQAGRGEESTQPEPEIPLNPDDLEQKYKKLLKDNDGLKKLVQYERGLREEMVRKIDQDQEIIKDLKEKLGE